MEELLLLGRASLPSVPGSSDPTESSLEVQGLVIGGIFMQVVNPADQDWPSLQGAHKAVQKAQQLVAFLRLTVSIEQQAY